MLYAIPVFMASIVIEAFVARRRAPDAYDLPDALTSLHFGILSQVWGAFTRVIGFGVYVLAFEHLRVTTLPADRVWVWLSALLFYDFCYYWAHRAGHEINLFWASHQVHHSSEYYNLTTALRQTATGGFTSWPFYIVMAVAGVPPVVFVTVGLIDLLYQYWVHTEFVGKLGWLDRVFVTPSNHRVHHGQNDYCIDRNYGGILVVWDRLFGTFTEERDGEKIVYGVRKPLASYNAAWGNLNVWTDLLRSSLAAPTPLAALRVWIDPPQGRGAALPHLDTSTVRRYDTGTRPAVRRYAIAQYLLLAPMVMHFLLVIERADAWAGIAYALLITATVVGVGWALEERPFARRVEALRVASMAAALLLLPDWFGWTAPLWAKATLAAAALATLALLPSSPLRAEARAA